MVVVPFLFLILYDIYAVGILGFVVTIFIFAFENVVIILPSCHYGILCTIVDCLFLLSFGLTPSLRPYHIFTVYILLCSYFDTNLSFTQLLKHCPSSLFFAFFTKSSKTSTFSCLASSSFSLFSFMLFF